MDIKSILGAVCACLTVVSFNVNAVVSNTLHGVDYQWLELTATQGLSRNQVEAQIASATAGDALFGYEYASRSLFSDLLHSYASWDGLNGWHGDTSVVYGMEQFVNDFGATASYVGDGIFGSFITVDGYSVVTDDEKVSAGLYGSTVDCGYLVSCYSYTSVMFDNLLDASMTYQHQIYGFDPLTIDVSKTSNSSVSEVVGSYLVRQVSPVPVPAAVWLFGSGLIGLICVARRKKA